APTRHITPPPPPPPAPPAPTCPRFATIATPGDTLAPAERVRIIYPRYVAAQPVAAADGLAVLAFRDGTPYQGEDLIYDAAAPERFLVRCSRNGACPTPGTCLYSRRIGGAAIVAASPRDRPGDWKLISDGIERLITSLRPTGG